MNFLVGNGRSGTCFIGNSLNNHPQLACAIEDSLVFYPSLLLAMDQDLQNDSRFVRHFKACYDALTARYKGHVYIDKCHQHALNIDFLKKLYPEAKFLHVIRDGRDVVLSMLEHKMIKSFFSERFVNINSHFPSKWYGIESKEHYLKWREMSLSCKCAMRWVSWVKTASESLRKAKPDNNITIKYEDLLDQPRNYSDFICDFFEVEFQELFENADKSRIGRWQRQGIDKEAIEIMRPTLVEWEYL